MLPFYEHLEKVMSVEIPDGHATLSSGDFYDTSVSVAADLTPSLFRVTYNSTIGVSLVGREEQFPLLQKRATAILGKEVYGEITRDLLALRELFWRDRIHYPDDHPIFQKMNEIFLKLHGEDK